VQRAADGHLCVDLADLGQRPRKTAAAFIDVVVATCSGQP
jgi:hypothetical protein